MSMYNKIFTKILDSSIWLESDATRIVWMTLIAAMDEHGMCQFASAANLGHRARVSREAAEQAVAILENPDADSSDPENEGRRIERVPGGWIVLNAEKYRAIVTRANSQERTRERVAKWRKAHKSVTECNDDVTERNDVKRSSNVSVTPSDTEAYTETKKKKPSPARKARERKIRNAPPCKTDISKARHKEFKAAIGMYWKSKNPSVEMPWGAPEGMQLEIWLRESPNTTIDQFTAYLRNRFKSDANHTERPCIWIRHITGYAGEPLNKFKQPQSLNGAVKVPSGTAPPGRIYANEVSQ